MNPGKFLDSEIPGFLIKINKCDGVSPTKNPMANGT
jgi:hypothetical protein